MMKKNYPINREFLPLSLYTPTISKESIARTNKLYHVPKAIFKDSSISINTFKIPSYNGGEIEMMLINPVGDRSPGAVLLEYTRRRFRIRRHFCPLQARCKLRQGRSLRRCVCQIQTGSWIPIPISTRGLLCRSGMAT